MGLTRISHKIQDRLPDSVPEFSWQRAVAAGSLIAGACLFLAGRRKTAVAIAVTGATVGLLEHPDAAKEIWESLPGYLKDGQEMLMRVEDFVNEVVKQGSKLRNVVG